MVKTHNVDYPTQLGPTNGSMGYGVQERHYPKRVHATSLSNPHFAAWA